MDTSNQSRISFAGGHLAAAGSEKTEKLFEPQASFFRFRTKAKPGRRKTWRIAFLLLLLRDKRRPAASVIISAEQKFSIKEVSNCTATEVSLVPTDLATSLLTSTCRRGLLLSGYWKTIAALCDATQKSLRQSMRKTSWEVKS